MTSKINDIPRDYFYDAGLTGDAGIAADLDLDFDLDLDLDLENEFEMDLYLLPKPRFFFKPSLPSVLSFL